MTAHLDGVSVALPSRFHSSRLPDIRNTVDGVLFAVLPDYLSGQHHAIGIEICIDLHIYFNIHNIIHHWTTIIKQDTHESKK